MEWGTGWCGVDLLLFHLLGAKHVHTIDHGNLLSFEFLNHLIPWFAESNLLEEVGKLGDAGAIHERFNRVLNLHEKGFTSLENLLTGLGVTYHVSKSCNPTRLDIPPKSVDLFYSSSVLQRIPESDLRAGIEFTSAQLLVDDAVFLHGLDQKDINAMSHVDSDLWRFHYLKYSDAFFNVFLNSRFNSQNRLRESDFLDLFQEFGLVAVYLQSSVFQSDIDRMTNFQVAKRFREKSVEDLAVNASIVIGCKSKTTGPDPRFHRDMVYQDQIQNLTATQ